MDVGGRWGVMGCGGRVFAGWSSGGLSVGCCWGVLGLGVDPGPGPKSPALPTGLPEKPPGPPTLMGPCGRGGNVGEGGTTTEALTPGGPKTGTVPTLAGPEGAGCGVDVVTPGGGGGGGGPPWLDI